MPSSIGFIALFGIALGNGMVLVTSLDELYRKEIKAIQRRSFEEIQGFRS